MTDPMGDLRAMIENMSTLHTGPEFVRISVTPRARPGSMLPVPMVGPEGDQYRARGIKQPRELRVHPDDWKRILDMIGVIKKPRYGQPIFHGIPVLIEEAP